MNVGEHELIVEHDGITDLHYGRCACGYHAFDACANSLARLRALWARHISRTTP